jgi:hypothetical protein
MPKLTHPIFVALQIVAIISQIISALTFDDAIPEAKTSYSNPHPNQIFLCQLIFHIFWD